MHRGADIGAATGLPASAAGIKVRAPLLTFDPLRRYSQVAATRAKVTSRSSRLRTAPGDSHRGIAWLVIGLMFLAAAIVTITLAVTMGKSLPLIAIGGGELLAALACAAAVISERKT
jgi:hypothetical protein